MPGALGEVADLARVDRLESLDEIRQLPAALARKPLLALMLVLVLVLAVASRAVGWAARLGLAALTVLLVLLAGVAVYRLRAMPAPIEVAYSAEDSQPVIPVHAKKPAKLPPAPVEKDNPAVEEAEESAIPLEAEPGKTPAPARPAWVDSEPARAGDVYRVAVSSGPQEKMGECSPALDEQLNRAVAAYIDEYLGSEAAGQCRVSDVIRYDLDYIKKHLVKRGSSFEEKLQMSFGPMYQTHALLDFGATRRYPRRVIEGYRKLFRGALEGDRAGLLAGAHAIGYFPADIKPRHREALLDLLELASEPLTHVGNYDFGGSDLPLRLREAGMVLSFEKGYWHDPPADAVFLHRKLGGIYLLAARLRARVDLGRIIESHI